MTAGDNVDVLVKRLAGGDRAVALFNHGAGTADASVGIDALGFDACSGCSYRIKNLWDGSSPSQIAATLPAHATALFRVSQGR